MCDNPELTEVYVYPDGEQYDTPPTWKSDDYQKRETMLCEKCDNELQVHYGEPYASCECGTTEWYH